MPITVFITVQNQDRLLEVDLPDDLSPESVHAALKEVGAEMGEDLILFHDDEDEPIETRGHNRPLRIKQGAKLHLTRCRKIDVTINYLDKTERHTFAPGTRIRRVKAWVVRSSSSPSETPPSTSCRSATAPTGRRPTRRCTSS
jgi:hypothetical protein